MAEQDYTCVIIPIGVRSKSGLFALVSQQDAEIVKKYKWRASKGGRSYKDNSPVVYAIAHAYSKGPTISMHRLILQPPKGMVVDHINGDALDNRRENLRIATRQQNQANSNKRKKKTSAYKGVSWCIPRKKWRAKLVFNGEAIYLGGFDSETDAAMAYDVKAIELFGEFAKTNFTNHLESAEDMADRL